MKKIIRIAVWKCIILSMMIPIFGKEKSRIILQQVHVDTPFEMPPIIMPDFQNCKQYNIVSFGALAHDKVKTTKAIATAIDKASSSGGGVVVVPKGEWITGAVHLKSNVNLCIQEGATLLFSEDPNDYLPAVHTTWEGMECYNYSPLIYAYGCENIAITGKGKVKALLDIWKVWYKRPKAHLDGLVRLYNMAHQGIPAVERLMVKDSANFRPQFIQFNRCQNVLLQDISIENSPFWVIHPYLCQHVIIQNINVFAHGHNNDGVDPEMSQNVLIEDCVFDQGDDAIAIKSGRSWDAWKLQTPSKNIIVRNCLVKNGHQLLAIGSELSGGIENVWMTHCRVSDNAKLNHLVFIKTNERQGGYVKNIFVNDVFSGKINRGILGIETDVLYQWRKLVPTYDRMLTPISHVYLENVKASHVNFVSNIEGISELPVDSVVLKNVVADTICTEKHRHVNLKRFVEQ